MIGTSSDRGRARRLLAVAAAVLALATVRVAAGQETGAAGVDTARAMIEKWTEARRLISKEKRDRDLAREVLNGRIEVLAREVEALKGRIAEADASLAEAESRRSDLLRENATVKAGSDGLAEIVAKLETRTLALVRRLPEPLAGRVRPLSQRLPAEGAESKVVLWERFQNVVGILNEVNKFQREISVTHEVRELEGNLSAQVTAVYVGIGQAFYASAQGDFAGAGRPAESSFVWTPLPGAGPAIRRVIAILENSEVASFVPLPVDIR